MKKLTKEIKERNNKNEDLFFYEKARMLLSIIKEHDYTLLKSIQEIIKKEIGNLTAEEIQSGYYWLLDNRLHSDPHLTSGVENIIGDDNYKKLLSYSKNLIELSLNDEDILNFISVYEDHDVNIYVYIMLGNEHKRFVGGKDSNKHLYCLESEADFDHLEPIYSCAQELLILDFIDALAEDLYK